MIAPSRRLHVTCTLCGGDSRFLCTTPNEHGPVPRIEHRRCLRCGTVFVATALTREDLAAAYATLDQSAYYDEIRGENRKKFETAAEALQRLVGRDAAVLDVGTGNGEFLEALQAKGFSRLAGHEIPGQALDRLRARGFDVYQDYDYSALPDAAFDAVCLLDVAEHVSDPRLLFAACFRTLRSGGLLYLHTPVVSRLDRAVHGLLRVPGARALGRAWQRGRTSIFHLRNYTARSLEALLRGAGFGRIGFVQRTELSWPVERYVRVYLCEKQGLPLSLAPVAAALFAPVLKSGLLNANKGIVQARRP